MNTFSSFPLKTLIAAAAAATLVACGGGDDAGGEGTLRLHLTDAPACGFDAVNVTVERVRMHNSASADPGASGWSELVLNPPRRLDLLELTNGVMETLGELPLPAGNYQQLRLVLADNGSQTPLANSVQPSGQAEVALKTPSGQQSGVKMNVDVDVAANQMIDLLIDFDACKSVVTAGASGQYLLKPVVRVLPYLISGVSGQIEAAAYTAGALVSLQQDGVVVRATTPQEDGRFVLQPAPTGSYSVVFTAPNRTTMVVHGVPVVADTVTTLGAPIAMPASAVGTAHGSAPVDTLVRAMQPLSGGPVIEVAGRYVDGLTGGYSFSLPTDAPLVASYVAPLAALDFVADAAAAGRYQLNADLAGFAGKTASLPALAAGGAIETDISFP